MEFYTSVNRWGNNILYRGYKDGKRVRAEIDFQPTLYVPTDENEGWQRSGKWRSLHGQPVLPLQMDSMKEATQYIKRYENVSNMQIFGTNNYVDQYICQHFPLNIEYDYNQLNIATIDIEVASDEGFPYPDQADHPVISIAMHSTIDDEYFVWGMQGYDTNNCWVSDDVQIDPDKINFIECTSEVDLLLGFLNHWSSVKYSPDIVTGWNTKLFDFPYLINRVTKLIGPDTAKMFSPWGSVQPRKVTVKFREHTYYEMAGIQQLDYMDLWLKFGVLIYGKQDNNKLDTIANTVLGESKLDYSEYGNLYTLYKHDYQKFITYNIKDVQLVVRLEQTMNLMALAMQIAYKAGTNFDKAFGTTAVWDAMIHRRLWYDRVAVPPKESHVKPAYPGGHVKEPIPGMYQHVASFDLNSLYPMTIVQYNMSPETLIPQNIDPAVTVDSILNGHRNPYSDRSMAANGIYFSNEKQGVIPMMVDSIYGERAAIKKEMLRLENEYQKNKDQKLKEQINRLDNQQMAIKILMNSLYGAMGNAHFRYFDWRVASAITGGGRLAIQWAERSINAKMNEAVGTTGVDYIVAIDTDSLYINMDPLVKKLQPKDPIAFMTKVCAEFFEKVLEKSYAELAEAVGAYTNKMVMAREVIADRGVWVAKKRYILNVHDKEGVRYEKPKLKIMGIEAIKSSTPAVCRGMMKELFAIIIQGDEVKTQQEIARMKREFRKLAVEDVSFPRGVSNITKYQHPQNVYVKGTTTHIRGALMYNHLVEKKGLDNKYESINNGESLKFVHLKMPNPIKENAISFPVMLPPEFNLHDFIDYNTQFQKALVDPIAHILDAIGWSVEPRSDLSAFAC